MKAVWRELEGIPVSGTQILFARKILFCGKFFPDGAVEGEDCFFEVLLKAFAPEVFKSPVFDVAH